MSNDVISFEQHGGLGVLTLNRPERLNAIDHDMLRALHAFWGRTPPRL
jgi:enoyl-CoA hydratase/carnithine racemase